MSSLRKPAPKHLQPLTFKFNEENLLRTKQIIAKYPIGRQKSAIMPLLDLVQKQQENNWIPTIAMDYIANILDIAPINVYEVATFYTMYNLSPVGKYFIQVCTTTPCWLRGSCSIISMCKNLLNLNINETTSDKLFTLVEVECLGACVNGPMMQINQDYYEDLTPQTTQNILESIKIGKHPKIGSQIGRKSCEPFK